MFEHGFPSDWSTIKKLIWLKGAGIIGGASAVWKTVTGALIHITDALASLTQKCEVTLEPIQSGSGDPSPTNVRPITGWTGTSANVTGANLADVKEENIKLGYYIDTSGNEISNQYNFILTPYIRVKPNTAYTLSMSSAVYFISISEYSSASQDGFVTRKSGSTGGNTLLTITTGSTTNYIRFGSNMKGSSGGSLTIADVLAVDWMLAEGSSVSPYKAYVGHTYSVTFPAIGINIYNSTANPIEQGSILGLNGQNTDSNARLRTNGYISAEASKLYYVSFTGLTRYYVHFYASDDSYLGHTADCVQNGESFTTLADTAKIRIVFATYPDATIRPSSISNIQVRDNVLYGGTYDFVSGVLTVDKALLTKNTSAMDNSENYPGWKNSGVKALMGEGISTVVYSTLNIGNEFSINTNNANDILFLSKNSYSKTQSEWISLAQDIQIIVPLAQQIEVQLTPQQVSTLAGENNVWGDGTIEMTYMAQA